eukprot:9471825-Pyramimonas_sp.AAC.1
MKHLLVSCASTARPLHRSGALWRRGVGQPAVREVFSSSLASRSDPLGAALQARRDAVPSLGRQDGAREEAVPGRAALGSAVAAPRMAALPSV